MMIGPDQVVLFLKKNIRIIVLQNLTLSNWLPNRRWK